MIKEFQLSAKHISEIPPDLALDLFSINYKKILAR
jgi:hypothetical protein